MTFLEAMQGRFACKLYSEQKIQEADLLSILEYGRLTPTSFGLEMWSFHVVENQAMRKQLYHACFDQTSVLSAPLSIVTLSRPASFLHPDGKWVKGRGARFPGSLSDFVEDYRPYYNFLVEEGRLESWSRSQGYLAVANMMTGAAALGIQSCAIEGFDEDSVLSLLALDRQEWIVSMVIPFGYPAEPARPKIRASIKELVVRHR
ncbi:MAG TPA: NAD(P)H-dependent oxidoreductase [Spirochaetales bacterium]|jgi:nitroreductase|nr:NAD(P)H-dependent oxidoreductase [Spirochaetales bacterium]